MKKIGGTLRIRNLKLKDEGFYKCRIKDEFKRIEAVTRLIIERKSQQKKVYEMCNKKYLTKNLKKCFFSKSAEYLKINKTFKSYLFLYSICFRSYNTISIQHRYNFGTISIPHQYNIDTISIGYRYNIKTIFIKHLILSY